MPPQKYFNDDINCYYFYILTCYIYTDFKVVNYSKILNYKQNKTGKKKGIF